MTSMLPQLKNWLNRRPLAFHLIAPFSLRKRALQMAWIGLNARLLTHGAGSLSGSVESRSGRVFLKTKDGVRILYDFTRRDGGLHPMYVYDHVYESAELEVIRKHFRADSTFIDIGANIGMHSIRALSENHQPGSVLAIEADETTFRRLEANIVENLREKIRAHRAVLWSSVAPIEWQGDQLEHGHNHAIAATTGARGVMSETLDSILARIGDVRKISVIKIDVEGAELEVLKGAERTLRTEKPALIVELEDRFLARNGASGEQLRDYLRALGYLDEIPIVNALSGHATNRLFLQP